MEKGKTLRNVYKDLSYPGYCISSSKSKASCVVDCVVSKMFCEYTSVFSVETKHLKV